MKNVCVFQNWGIGDLVMTVPVIAELRRLYPDGEITLITRGKPQVALMEGSPNLDRVLEVPPNKSILNLFRFFIGLRKYKFDAVVIGTRISPLVALLLRCLSRVGVIIGDGQKYRWLYTFAGQIDPKTHRVDRMLQTLGLWTQQAHLPAQFPLPIPDSSRNAAANLLRAKGVSPGAFVAIHPGSSRNLAGEKRIPIPTAKALIAQIRANHPSCAVLLLFGPDDIDMVSAFTGVDDRVFIVDNIPLSVTKAILASATCFVGSDSALGHIAASFGVPTVTMAGPTIPSETRPYGDAAVVLTRAERLHCQPCWGTALHGRCPYDARCMTDIPAEALYAPVKRSLAPPDPTMVAEVS